MRGNTHGCVPFSVTLPKTHSGNLHIDGIGIQERCVGIFICCEFHVLNAPLTVSLVFGHVIQPLMWLGFGLYHSQGFPPDDVCRVPPGTLASCHLHEAAANLREKLAVLVGRSRMNICLLVFSTISIKPFNPKIKESENQARTQYFDLCDRVSPLWNLFGIKRIRSSRPCIRKE